MWTALALVVVTAALVAVSLPRDVPIADPSGAPPSLGHAASPSLLPVRVTFLDAITGEEVTKVRWREGSRRSSSDDLARRRDLVLRRSGDTAVLPFPFDGIAIHPPEGSVALPPLVLPSLPIARARAAALIVLLEREAIVTLVYEDEEGWQPAFRVKEADVAGSRLRSDVVKEGDRLRGIPFRRGALLHLVLRIEEGAVGEWCGTGRDEVSVPVDPDMEWWGRMGEDPATPILVDPILPGRQGGPEVRAPDPWGEISLVGPGDLSPRYGWVDLTVRGSVRLRLLDRAGDPAPGVHVAVRSVKGRTDEGGRVALEGVPGGEHLLRVLDEGWAFPPTRIAVSGDEVSDVVALELVGGALEVRVQDPDGNPIPFATLAVLRDDRRSFWDVDDAGVRRLDPYVGVDGRRVFRHVPPGALAVRAEVGSREAQARVEVVDGGHHVVTITLPQLDPR